jgi:hypothetical protein
MKEFIDAMQTEDSKTANGAITHSTAGNACLDLFFLAGASRKISDQDIIKAFNYAMDEDLLTACKILFWARDARGGAGEKRFFQVIMSYLRVNHPAVFEQLAIHVPNFGYWKDVFKIELPDDNNLNWLMHQLEESENKNLLAKWFPRKGVWFTAMHKYLKMSPKEFRKKLVGMSRTVEQSMCANQWDQIEYSKVPSVAGKLYSKSFHKHDSERYGQYIKDVLEGKTKINASVLFPSDIIMTMNGANKDAMQALWMNLPNYMEGSSERILPVCDVSGSMKGLPMAVSIGLGMYISERNEGPFKDFILTFSSNPEFHRITGNDIWERYQNLSKANWDMSTNLYATFDLLLTRAKVNNVSADAMPTKLLIISDMQFDQAAKNTTNFDAIKAMYEEAGYQMPGIIFWNVNGQLGNVPVKAKTPNTALVSGFSPSILTSLLGGDDLTPMGVMLKTINADRYSDIMFHP